MLVLDKERTAALLPLDRLVAALRQAFAAAATGSGVTSPERHQHRLSERLDATLLLMPAWAEGEYLGVKLVNIFPRNREQGLPALTSAYVLSSGQTGQVLAMVDGYELTRRRTAAASALAAGYLAPGSVGTHLVVGAGNVAELLPQAYAATVPVQRTLVFNRTRERAADLVGRLRAQGHDAHVAEDLRAAVREADVVSAATLSTEPIVLAEDVRSGTHVDLIGGFTLAMREADDDLVDRASVFVDVEEALHECGDLAGPIARGRFHPERTRAGLADLVSGRHTGRSSADEVTLFKSVGTALEDLAGARLAYEAAGRPGSAAEDPSEEDAR